jgi:hypothetical protein
LENENPAFKGFFDYGWTIDVNYDSGFRFRIVYPLHVPVLEVPPTSRWPELPLKPGTGAGFFLLYGGQPSALNNMSPIAAASSHHSIITAAIAKSASIW